MNAKITLPVYLQPAGTTANQVPTPNTIESDSGDKTD